MRHMQTAHTELADFWEASSLSSLDAAAFGNRVLAFEGADPGVPAFSGAGAPIGLEPVRDRYQRSLEARRSGRRFSAIPLRHRQVERILASVGCDATGRRVVPSAGGLGTVHTFGVASAVEGPLASSTFRYDASAHAAARIGDAPDAATVRHLFQLDCEGLPQLMLVFVADLGPVTRKYGARGGRFMIQEAGHACQNVSLRLARDGLAGYVLGGALDIEVLSLLGLAHLDAAVVGAMACGR